MHNLQALQVFDALGKLTHNDPGFVLTQSTALLEKALEVEAVCILLNHVDLVRRLDCLVVTDAKVAAQHAVYLHLLEDHLEILFGKVFRVVDLARKYFL